MRINYGMRDAGCGMRVRPALVGLFVGVVSTALCAAFALHGRDLRWQRDAWEHYSAVYYTDYSQRNAPMRWMWLDDYFAQELKRVAPHRAHRGQRNWQKL